MARSNARCFVLYFALHSLLTFTHQALLWRPPELASVLPGVGLLFSFCVVFSRRVWWGLGLGAISAELAFAVVPLLGTGRIADAIHLASHGVQGCAAALLGAWLLRRADHQRWSGEVAFAARALASAFIAVACVLALAQIELRLHHARPGQAARALVWSLSAFLGILLVGPPILLRWWSYHHQPIGTAHRPLELAALYATKTALVALAFGPLGEGLDLQYLLLLTTLWAAARFEPHLAVLAASAKALGVIVLHQLGFGPFAQEQDRFENTLIPLQLFVVVLLSKAFLLSVALSEWRAERERLRQLALQLRDAEDATRRAAAIALHDGVGQMLIAIGLRLAQLRGASSSEASRHDCSEIAELVAEAERNARSLMVELTPPALHDLGLCSAITAHCRRIESECTLSISVDLDRLTDELPAELRNTIFRAVVELLRNVLKHADARSATVKLRRRLRRVEIEVSDNGSGFRPTTALIGYRGDRFGLFSLRDDAIARGGQFEIIAAPDEGCTVRLSLPTQA